MAMSLDPDTLKVRGQPKQVFDGIVTHEGQGFADFAIAADKLSSTYRKRKASQTFFQRSVQAHHSR